MAELILTDEEKAAATWLELSDDALEKIVRRTCLLIKDVLDDATGMRKLWHMAALMLLCDLTAESNAETATFTINGLTSGDKQNGD